jgi:hypothetical protein
VPDQATRRARTGRTLVAFGAAALLVLTPMRVLWSSEATGILGPFVMWSLLVVLTWLVLRSPRGPRA